MKRIGIITAILVCGLITSCIIKKATVSDSEMEAQGFVKAMVVQMDLDGCGYMIELPGDKAKLEPDGLQPDFQHDSLAVWIKYKPVDRMSVCMAGQTIDLLEIKKR